MTKISWTNETWNPIIGCSKISEGCKNCYAEKMAWRLAHIDKTKYYSEVVENRNNRCWNGKTHFVESALKKPFKWKKQRMIFVCSMGDLFHESLDFKTIRKVFDVMRACPQHTFQILTKRPKIMQAFFEKYYGFQNEENIWLGVTCENQEQANKRIPILLQIPAKVHFVSVEPMLSRVNLFSVDNEINQKMSEINPKELEFSANYIDWVICGGESGHNARPIKKEWVVGLKDQCKEVEVPFFFKQWNKKKDGSLLDDKEYKQFPKINKL